MITQRRISSKPKKLSVLQISKQLSSFNRLHEEDDEPHQLSHCSPSSEPMFNFNERNTRESREFPYVMDTSDGHPHTTLHESNVTDQKALEIARFILAIYETELKLKKSVADKALGILKKRFRHNEVDVLVRRANKLTRQMSGNFCPSDTREINYGNVLDLRRTIETFITEIQYLIAAEDHAVNSMRVVQATQNFLSRWNRTLPVVDGTFLLRYGVVKEADLQLEDASKLTSVLRVIQNCAGVPSQIRYLKDDHLENVIRSCNLFSSTWGARHRVRNT